MQTEPPKTMKSEESQTNLIADIKSQGFQTDRYIESNDQDIQTESSNTEKHMQTEFLGKNEGSQAYIESSDQGIQTIAKKEKVYVNEY